MKSSMKVSISLAETVWKRADTIAMLTKQPLSRIISQIVRERLMPETLLPFEKTHLDSFIKYAADQLDISRDV